VARLILLDASPLGEVSKPRNNRAGDEARAWLAALVAGGALVYIPEIADYEVRRKLIHTRMKQKLDRLAGLERLDELKATLVYLPITTTAMLKAAEMWAELRYTGVPTAGPDSLDGDAILAGQAATAGGLGDIVTIATNNIRHFSRFSGVDAALWTSIV
jgi:predicted nucleic acid-binding protein